MQSKVYSGDDSVSKGDTMKLLFYTPENYNPGKRLQEALNTVAPEECFSICHGVDDLSRLLRRPIVRPDVAVFFPSTREELAAMIAMRKLFMDLRIILVLPDDSKDMVSEALTLHPRFLSDPDLGFYDVAAVLKKMLARIPIRESDL